MLAQMQQQFRDWLVASTDDAKARLHVGSQHGLVAYQNNYRTQLVNCLKASYPQLLAYLGEDVFLQAAIHHIDEHPPSSWTLDAYGADFDDTLRLIHPHNPDIHELAWLEWSLSDVFVAADASSITLDQLTDVDWDTARLTFVSGFRHRTVTTNMVAIWSAWQESSALPDAAMLDEPAGIIVWRRGFSCQMKQVDAIEHASLQIMQEDGRFNVLCEALIEHLGEQRGVNVAGGFLANWLALGFIAGVK